MAPRGSSVGPSSPIRAASHPIARRLDFEQDESSLQETPALSGSGARRGKRSSIYDIPEDASPEREESALLEESYVVQEEIIANEDSVVINNAEEESFAAQIGEDTITGAEATEVDIEESEIAPEPVKEPAKRGRKRKSDALEPVEETDAAKLRKQGTVAAQASATQKKGKKSTQASAPQPRRLQRVSDITELEPSILEEPVDKSVDITEQAEAVPVVAKRRGRPPRVQPDTEKEKEKEKTAPVKGVKSAAVKEKTEAVFRKPVKPTPKAKANTATQAKADIQTKDKTPQANSEQTGKLVNSYGNPLSKKDIEQMSTTSAGSRFGRGRHLSVFREMDPEAVACVGRTGRHRVAPIDFWKNESISYDVDGSMTAIVKNQDPEPETKKSHYRASAKSRKRNLTAIEEEEIELEPWEDEEGVFIGNYRDFDQVTNLTMSNVEEGSKSWLRLRRCDSAMLTIF